MDWLYTNITDTRLHAFITDTSNPERQAPNQIAGLYTNSFDVLTDYHQLRDKMIPWPANKPLVHGDRVFVYRRHIKKHREHKYDGALVAWGTAASAPHTVRFTVPATGEEVDRLMVTISLVMIPPEYQPGWDILTGDGSPLKTVPALTSGSFAPPTKLTQEQAAFLTRLCLRHLRTTT